MSELITGMYDSRSDAYAAVEKLAAAGIDRAQITVTPESENADYQRSDARAYDHQRDEGGFWASLKDFFFPDETRYTYSEGLSRGGTIVTVMANDTQVGLASSILDDHGSIDLDDRTDTWRAGGWKGYDGVDASGRSTFADPASTPGGIQAHMDVIAADGTKMGTVDHLEGQDQIKLAKNTSPDGQHHFVPLAWVDHVDAHVHLKKMPPEIQASW